MNITLIAPTYKRPEICNRLIQSVPDNINIVIIGLSDTSEIIRKKNVHIHVAEQMPLTNALNLGVRICDDVFPYTEAYRTKTCYAQHKQGTAKGGYWQAVKEGNNIGKADEWLTKYLDYNINKPSGYEYIADNSVKIKPLAISLHKSNNIKLNG